jgi:hypothetical protein
VPVDTRQAHSPEADPGNLQAVLSKWYRLRWLAHVRESSVTWRKECDAEGAFLRASADDAQVRGSRTRPGGWCKWEQ